jgi:type VI protein secretion system component Hcp
MTDERTTQHADDDAAVDPVGHADDELTDENLDGISGGNVTIGDISITKSTDKSAPILFHP